MIAKFQMHLLLMTCYPTGDGWSCDRISKISMLESIGSLYHINWFARTCMMCCAPPGL
jgi:hypothetical protein